MSSADARLLVRWLDAGVPVPAILAGIERAAEVRRARRSRLPLTLGQAKRYIEGAPAVARAAAAPPPTPGRPFAAVAASLREQVAADPGGVWLAELAVRLDAIEGDDAETVLRAALAEVRWFLEAVWDGLGDEGRAARLAAASAELADLGLDEADLARAAEALARDDLRRGYPSLTMASLWERLAR